MSKSGITENPEYLSGDQLTIQDQPAGDVNPMMSANNQNNFNRGMGQPGMGGFNPQGMGGMGQPGMGGFNPQGMGGMGQPRMGGFNPQGMGGMGQPGMGGMGQPGMVGFNPGMGGMGQPGMGGMGQPGMFNPQGMQKRGNK